jgi:SAM-dependent methyltransferase
MTDAPLELAPTTCAVCRVDDAEPIAVGEDFEYRTVPDSFLMMRCRRCGLVYLNPRPADREGPRIYPDHYHAFNFSEAEFGLIHRVRRRLEARRLLRWCRGLPADARILDVGCGDGFHLGLLREFGEPTWTLRGVDVDSRAVAQARRAGLDVVEGTVETLPKDHGYHLALMIMTVEHLPSPVETIRAVAERLLPGGRLVIVTDNVRSPDFAVFGGRHWGGYHFPRHTYLFDRDTLSRLAAAAQLGVERISTGLSPVNWVYSFRNWIDDWGGPRWLVNRFSLQSPVGLAVFTLVDAPFSVFGRGAILQAEFVKPNHQGNGAAHVR